MCAGTVEVSTDDSDDLKTKELAVGQFSFAVAHKKGFTIHHFLDVSDINHPDPNTLIISFTHKPPLGLAGPNAHAICSSLLESYDAVFFGLPSSSQWTRRVRSDLLPAAQSGKKKRMDGFSALYRAYCGLAGVACREDIAWDVDNVLHPGGVVAFDAREFEQPTESRDLVALFKALQHNSHFRELHVAPMSSKSKMEREPLIAAAEIFLNNRSISVVSFSDCAPHLSAAIPVLSNALSLNHSALSSLSLASNGLDDKDIAALSTGIGAMEHGLVLLNLANNEMTKKGAQSLAAALQKNARLAQTLCSLNLSQNKLGADGSAALAVWLASPNSIRDLSLRDTNITVSVIAQALAKGSQFIEKLDISQNKFAKGGSVAELTALLVTTSKLTSFNMAGCGPSTEQLKDVLRALSSNSQLEQMELDVSGNSLGVVGANLLAIEAKQFASLTSLNCADNAFKDKGLGILCDSLCDNERLVKLDLSDNFDYVAFRKSKATSSLFVESLGNCVMSEKCALRELRIASTQKGTQMKAELATLLVDMGSNRSIVALDVSGQGLEYGGFVGLTKLLQLNKTLRKLVMDDNGIDLQCLRALSNALDRNATLQEVPLPSTDVAVLLGKADVNGKREFASVWSAIESALHRNHSVSPSAGAEPARRTITFGRASNVRTASLLFDRGEELETMRFTIRVAPQNNVTPDHKVLLNDVDNHHQSALALAGLRSRALDKTKAQVLTEVQKVASIVSLQVQAAADDLGADVTDFVKKSFPSLSGDCHAKVAEAMGRPAGAADFKSALLDAVISKVEDVLDVRTSAQLQAVAELVQEALLTGMKSMLQEIDNRPSVSMVTRSSVGSSPPQSPRTATKSGASPRSAAEVLRKFSGGTAASEAVAIPAESATPESATQDEKKKTKKGSHSRSKSSAAGSRMPKSPRVKKLSIAEPIEVSKQARRLSGMLPSNALVSAGALETMLAEEGEVTGGASSGKKSTRRRRRPRGPSTMFAAEDLMTVHDMVNQHDEDL